MSEITLSVALVTRNRPDSLDRTLQSLRRQNVQPLEVIVSDDSDGRLRQHVAEISQKYDCQYQPGPKGGLYANRNAAARACRGTHFRTMDDDHEFPPDHILRCVEAVKGDDSAIWIIGEIHSTEVGGEIANISCPGELHPRGFSKPPTNPENCRAISCGATIYPRSVVDLNILNVEYFRFGITYLEYGCRLTKLGYRIRHLRDTYVVHHSDLQNQSFPNDDIALAAQIFSMASLAFTHEPSLVNKLQFAAELGRIGIIHPLGLSKALWPAIRAYRQHSKAWERQLGQMALTITRAQNDPR